MKLAHKLMAAVMLAIISLLAVHGYLTVRRELRLFNTEMRREAHLLGTVLAGHIAEIWQANGSTRVSRLIEDSNKAEGHIHVRWVWLDAPEGDPNSPRLDRKTILPVLSGREVVSRGVGLHGEECLFTYIPVPLRSERRMALELGTSLSAMRMYTRNTIIRNLVLIGAILLVSSILVFWLGASMVGRPIQALVKESRRIASGDLEGEVVLKKRGDELTDLANELNLMFDQLRQSQRRLQAETSKRIAALEQLHHAERLATIGKLSSGLAHELGTPLNVILGRTKMISTHGLSPATVEEYAHIIKEQAEKMTAIVRQLLAYSRRSATRKGPVGLSESVNQVLKVLRPVGEEKGVRFIFDGTADCDGIMGDRDQIEQVLTNLFMNAVQAMPEGGEVRISIGHEAVCAPVTPGGPEAEYLCLKVTDQGRGIDSKDMERIFDPFFTTKPEGEGTGLGLSICFDIIQEHGGWFSVESEPGKGSCFSIYLPLETWKCTDEY